MKFKTYVFSALAALVLPPYTTNAQPTAFSTALNLTAISASSGNSVLECWALPGFVASAQAGTVGALNLVLGDLANATYTVIPPRLNGGLHKAPAPQ